MPEAAIIAITLISLAIVIGMTVNGIVGKVMDGKRLRHEAKAALPGPEVREVLERQQQIEERLRVLERIATDRGSLLADEIEALRRDTLAGGQPKLLVEAGAQ
jgi:hypothetical protein